MGVPKFFRWISERYPKINQPIHAPPNPDTQANYFPSYNASNGGDGSGASGDGNKGSNNGNGNDNNDNNSNSKQDHKVYIQKNSITPEFDRLYLDMNGIIHCSSHNNASDDNATVDPDTHIEPSLKESIHKNKATNNNNKGPPAPPPLPNDGSVRITEAEIFRNVCYYVDRVVSDIAKPNELVYMAIDGVAPRAKMNQQRSRRYRSGKEKEIESTFYGAHLLAQKKQKMLISQQEADFNSNNGNGNGNSNRDDFNNEHWDIQGVGGLQHPDPTINASTEKPRFSTTAAKKQAPPQTSADGQLEEVEPGRYTGTFETTSNDTSSTNSNQSSPHSSPFDLEYQSFLETIFQDPNEPQPDEEISHTFHSNTITPGTPFFERCTKHLQHFIKRKLQTDERWKDLTIIFSGPNVPGEGEHKIMDFIRRQKKQEDYDPNTTHCMFGQDGDLIMLGLATHEPHFALLREEVVFDQSRKREHQKMAEMRGKLYRENLKDIADGEGGDGDGNIANEKVSASIDSYIHNSNFELLHMPILRDYLAYEFETREVLPNSPFELENTIDDFVFMTFIVGNDFLPHMPAIDIADEAFDLLFYTYKRNRWKWLKDEKGNESKHPYLTNAGQIVSGKRLERFFTDLGKHEDPYYDNKKRSEEADLKRLRKSDKKAGRDSSVPPDAILAAKEEWDRTSYVEMLMSISEQNAQAVDGFKPVSSSRELFAEFDGHNKGDKKNSRAGVKGSAPKDKEYKFQPDSNEELDEGFMNRMGTLFRNSLSNSGEDGKINTGGVASDDSAESDGLDLDKHVADLKGRYYYEKFNFSPLDAEKHIALRKSYIEGLVWNLQYYYKGCASWDWFYPYHYGPRLSDLKDIDNMLKGISFEENPGEPLKPFEQLMACLPPSSADLLPKPYQFLMKSSKSPIIDFYPDSFTIDMNGKRWPWEAVVLLPFIDSKRLIESSRKMVPDSLLTDDERRRNELGNALVYTRDEAVSNTVPALNNRPNFGTIEDCHVLEKEYNDTSWKDEHLAANSVLRPELLPGAIVPYPGFPTLRDAPVHGLTRRKLGINVFGMRSRYRTAVLQLDREIPMITSAEAIAGKFIGTTLYFRYPFLQEGFVTAVSDTEVTVRGKEPARIWSAKESQTWKLKNDTIKRQYETGEGLTGSGGWNVPESEVTLSIRPLKEIQTLSDGSKVKIYARLEVEVPIVASIWSPSKPDPRFTNIPARLEKNPYRFGSQLPSPSVSIKSNRRSLRKSRVGDAQRPTSKILPDFNSNATVKTGILPPSSMKNGILGSTSNFSTLTRPTIAQFQARTLSRSSLPSIGTSLRQISQRRTSSRAVTAVVALAAACFAKGANAAILSDTGSVGNVRGLQSSLSSLQLKGGEISWKPDVFSNEEDEESTGAPPLEFAHGTTTLSFIFDGGILAAVDSRASIGNFVGSKTTQKVLPINNHMLGTMAGGAADCSFWIRKLQAESRHFELAEGRPITVARVSRLLADYLYGNRNSDLSVGTMIMGYDELGPSIYYVDNKGTRIGGDSFSVGSGSTFALGVLDTEMRKNIKEDEAIALGIKAIRHATFRDAFSGGYIAVYVITKDGWKKVFSEDLGLSVQS